MDTISVKYRWSKEIAATPISPVSHTLLSNTPYLSTDDDNNAVSSSVRYNMLG